MPPTDCLACEHVTCRPVGDNLRQARCAHPAFASLWNLGYWFQAKPTPQVVPLRTCPLRAVERAKGDKGGTE